MGEKGFVLVALVGCVQAGEAEDVAAWVEPYPATGSLTVEAADEADDEPGDPGERMATSSSSLDCGATITHDTRLRHDIGPCQGDGLVIADDDVELDCDGHRILGGGGGIGVLARGVDDAEVENCHIEDFETGIFFDGVDGGEIEDNELNTGWEPPDVAPDCVRLDGSNDVEVEDNHVVACRGFTVSVGEDVELEDNEVEDGEIGFFVANVTESRLEDNSVRRSSSEAFLIINADDNEFEDNEVKDGAAGFLIESDSNGNHFEGNEVKRNDNFGFFLLESHENEFEHNEANDNGTNGFELSGSDDNEFEDNEANDNDGIGFWLFFGSDDNDFEDNEACGNGDVDLFVDADSEDNDFDDNDFCDTEGT